MYTNASGIMYREKIDELGVNLSFFYSILQAQNKEAKETSISTQGKRSFAERMRYFTKNRRFCWMRVPLADTIQYWEQSIRRHSSP